MRVKLGRARHTDWNEAKALGFEGFLDCNWL